MRYYRWCIVFFLFVSSLAFGQAGKPKFVVYKSDVNPNAVKEGIRGIAVLFSCEYNFSDAEYAAMKNGEGRNYFTFYASMAHKNNESFYSGLDYRQAKKAFNTIALHVAEEHAYEPQNKAQGRRNTGIELFIPFYQLNLPEGTNAVKFILNATTEKDNTFERIHTQDIAINKPPVTFISLQPKQITVTDKAGKKYEAESIEQDLFAIPGNSKTSTDIISAGNVSTKMPFTFIYSEGDVVRLKLQKSTSKGVVSSNKVRVLKASNGQMMTNFDNKASLQGEWPMDPKQKTIALTNPAVQINLDVSRTKVPGIRITEFAINPYSTHEGVAGATLTIAYEAKNAAGAPALVAVPSYVNASQETVLLKGGIVTSGKNSIDSTGAIALSQEPGKISVFYPAFNLLLYHPGIRQQTPNQFAVQMMLQSGSGLVTQKQIKQNLPVSVIQDARIAPAVKAKDTTFNNIRGLAINIPYQFPKLYTDLQKDNLLIQLTEASAKDSRGADLLRNMTLVNNMVEKINDPTNKKGASFRISKPAGVISLFLPYTDLNRQEKAPVPFFAKAVISQNGVPGAEVGGNSSAIRFDIDTKKLRFVTLGISNINLKKANTGDIMWRITSSGRTIYQSVMIPAAKTIDNLYTHAGYMHEDDVVAIEMLKGKTTADAKLMFKWEKPVKELTASEILELEPSKLPNNTDDGDTKSVSIMYSVQ